MREYTGVQRVTLAQCKGRKMMNYFVLCGKKKIKNRCFFYSMCVSLVLQRDTRERVHENYVIAAFQCASFCVCLITGVHHTPAIFHFVSRYEMTTTG